MPLNSFRSLSTLNMLTLPTVSGISSPYDLAASKLCPAELTIQTLLPMHHLPPSLTVYLSILLTTLADIKIILNVEIIFDTPTLHNTQLTVWTIPGTISSCVTVNPAPPHVSRHFIQFVFDILKFLWCAVNFVSLEKRF